MSIVLEFANPPTKPILRGQDHFWEVMCELHRSTGRFTIGDILGRCNGVHYGTVAEFVNRLVKGGYAEKIAETPNGRRRPTPVYKLLQVSIATPRLARDGSPASQGAGQQQMWNVLRGSSGRTGVSAADLAMLASTEEAGVKVVTAQSYIDRLVFAGYLVKADRSRWRLKPGMNTGPRPPMILRSKFVYDQNRREAMAPITAEEDRP